MKKIGPNDIMEIRIKYMKQNKIPTKIYFPVSKYECSDVWKSPSAIPSRIFGIEVRESLTKTDIVVEYKTVENYYE